MCRSFQHMPHTVKNLPSPLKTNPHPFPAHLLTWAANTSFPRAKHHIPEHFLLRQLQFSPCLLWLTRAATLNTSKATHYHSSLPTYHFSSCSLSHHQQLSNSWIFYSNLLNQPTSNDNSINYFSHFPHFKTI